MSSLPVISHSIDKSPEGEVEIRFLMGNTDSDCGEVVFNLIPLHDTSEDGVPMFEVDVSTEGGNNWGLIACACAVRGAVEYFIAHGFDKQFYVLDNTGLKSF